MSTLASKAGGLQCHEACASEFGILTLCVLQCIFSTRQSLKSIVKFVDRGPFHIHPECAQACRVSSEVSGCARNASNLLEMHGPRVCAAD